MSKIRLNLAEDMIINGKQISFQAPCNSADTAGLIINNVEYDIVDAIGDSVLGIDNMWACDAIVSVILNTNTNKAYIQNLHDVPCEVILMAGTYEDEKGVIYSFKSIDADRILKLTIFNDMIYNSNPGKFNRHCDFTNSSWSYAMYILQECIMDINCSLDFMFEFTPNDSLTIDSIDKSCLKFRSTEDDTIYSYPENLSMSESNGSVLGTFIINHSALMQKTNTGIANFIYPDFASFIEDAINMGTFTLYIMSGSKIKLRIY